MLRIAEENKLDQSLRENVTELYQNKVINDSILKVLTEAGTSGGLNSLEKVKKIYLEH